MTLSEFNRFHSDIEGLIIGDSLYDAFRRMNLICDKLKFSDISAQIKVQESTYKYMLQYFVSGEDDPGRESMLSSITAKLLLINDAILTTAILSKPYFPYPEIKEALQETSTISEGRFCTDDSNIFEYIAYTPSLSENTKKAINNELSSLDGILRRKEAIISALFISALICFNKYAITTLLDTYITPSAPMKLRMRAFVALYLLSHKYWDRMTREATITSRMAMLNDMPQFQKDIEIATLQHLKCKNSENLNKRVEKEILPDIMKHSSDIFKNGASRKFITDESDELNPEWESILDDSEVSAKIQNMNEMQFDGADMFMSTLKFFKSHSAFQQPLNWLVSYYAYGTKINESAPDDEMSKILSQIELFSDTDKLAMTLALDGIDTQMRNMVISNLKEQSAALDEYMAENLETADKRRRFIIQNVLRDLNRFFHFTPLGQFTGNPINMLPSMNKSILRISKSTQKLVAPCAEYSMKYKLYDDAIDMLTMQAANETPTTYIYQKIGFCHQNMKRYDTAIENYKKAELLGDDSKWLITHLAQCYKAIDNNAEALFYYQKLDTLSPDNVSVLLNIGHILLGIGDIEGASKSYYKANYLSGDSPRTIRPIAWCEFMCKNYDKSREYYLRIPKDKFTASDYLNFGHLYFALGELESAKTEYISCVNMLDSNLNQFKDNYTSDSATLSNHGISIDQQKLMLDAVCFDYNVQA